MNENMDAPKHEINEKTLVLNQLNGLNWTLPHSTNISLISACLRRLSLEQFENDLDDQIKAQCETLKEILAKLQSVPPF